MSKRILVIANKRYSSWSLRPWLMMEQAGIPFEEKQIFLRKPDSAKKIKVFSESGRVPVLIEGDIAVWESLAIGEYLAESFPNKNLWPKNKAARAAARAIASEMHAGFTALRTHCPMNCVKQKRGVKLNGEVLSDVARIQEIWRDARKKFGKEGAFLFGQFSIADAMYAPVVTRFQTYGIPVDMVSRSYMEAILSLPAMQEWIRAAKEEKEIIPDYE